MKFFNKKYAILVAAAFLGVVTSCDDMFEPAAENIKDTDYLYAHGDNVQGILANAYTSIPTGSFSFNEIATDDAVSNDASNYWLKMATGSWAADNNPINRWGMRTTIQYINQFLTLNDNTIYSKEEVKNELFKLRQRGEAYAFRALYNYYMLEAHAGMVDGVMMGIPIVTQPETATSNFNYPRNTFAECIEAILSDLEEAEKYLPERYIQISSSNSFYEYINSIQKCSIDEYNKVYGESFSGMIDKTICRYIKAKAYMLASSPAFEVAGAGSWEKSAEEFAKILELCSFTLDNEGNQWYTLDCTDLASGQNIPEVLWRSGKSVPATSGNVNTREKDNFPVTLNGTGRVNPTQNFVDCFPMANGYPITDASSGYDQDDMYSNRDPRLKMYVICNGDTYQGKEIITSADSKTDDGLNKVATKSTRTGYYLKKLLNPEVTISNSGDVNQKAFYTPRIRFTEVFLNYAEAANEAYGPTGKGSAAMSAYEVVKAIRQRGGITSDDYLESIKSDKDKMRELIRNERRIELCFEGHRFYDLKRWKQLDKIESCKGVRIEGGKSTIFEVEARNYKEYQNYGPLPYNDVLNFSELKQNQGW